MPSGDCRNSSQRDCRYTSVSFHLMYAGRMSSSSGFIFLPDLDFSSASSRTPSMAIFSVVRLFIVAIGGSPCRSAAERSRGEPSSAARRDSLVACTFSGERSGAFSCINMPNCSSHSLPSNRSSGISGLNGSERSMLSRSSQVRPMLSNF